MFSRSSASSMRRCTYGLSLSASAPAPTLAAVCFAAIELPRLACGCRREHTRTAPTFTARRALRRLERELEHVLHVVEEAELDVLAEMLRDILAIALVQLRRDDQLDAVALGGERLLLQPADGQDLAGQGDLPGHRHLAAHDPSGDQRAQRGGHRDARARAVLGDRAGGNMDVQVVGCEPVLG